METLAATATLEIGPSSRQLGNGGTSGGGDGGPIQAGEGPDLPAPVAHWRFDGDADDSAGSSHGAARNGASFTANGEGGGVGSHALVLDGSDDHVDLDSHVSSFPLGDAARTVTGWFRADVGNQGQSFLSYGPNVAGQRFSIAADRTQVVVGVSGHGWGVNGLDLADGWHHIAVTYAGGDSDGILIYLDGVPQSAASLVGAPQTLDTRTGPAAIGRNVGGTKFYAGSIDDVRMYDVALSAEQVPALLGEPPQAPPPVTPAVTASATPALAEDNLDGAQVTLTLDASAFAATVAASDVTASGVTGLSVSSVTRDSDSQITASLAFDGTDFDVDATLTLAVSATALIHSDTNLSATLPVTAVDEPPPPPVTTSVTATATPVLAESNLDGAQVTLTLDAGAFAATMAASDVTASGVTGLSVSSVTRDSDSQITASLAFDGTDFDADATLTLALSAAVLSHSDANLSATLPVTAVDEPLPEDSIPAPLAHWPFDGDADDSAGSSDGTTMNGAAFVTNDEGAGVGSHTLSLDGVDDHVDLATHASSFPMGDSARSVSGWFHADAGNQGQAFFSYGPNLPGQRFSVAADRTQVVVGVSGHGWGVNELDLDHGWHHIAVTYAGGDSDRVSIYLDGALQTASTIGGTPQALDTQTGPAAVGRSVGGTKHYAGSIDDLRLYDFALTAEQVQALFDEYPQTVTAEITATATPALAEDNLNGAQVTLTLDEGSFAATVAASDVTTSGVTGLSISSVTRDSDSQATATLTFDGTDFDTNATLTLTVSAAALSHSETDLSATLPVTAVDEPPAPPVTTSITASATPALAESNLDGAQVTLTLDEGSFATTVAASDVTASGVSGVSVSSVTRDSDGQVSASLTFDGTDFDADATLTLAVSATALAHADANLSATLPVTAVDEPPGPPVTTSVTASATSALAEDNLDGAQVTLTLDAGSFAATLAASDVTVSGVTGLSVSSVTRDSDSQATVSLAFDGTDFSADATLTLTVSATALVHSDANLSATLPVAAVDEQEPEVEIPAPVVHWRFDGDADDSAGSSHGAVRNGASFTTAASVGSHALSLDGSDDFVDLDPYVSGFLRGNSTRSVTGWFRADAGNQRQTFFTYGPNAEGRRFAIAADRTQALVAVTGHAWGVNNLSLADGWHHIAVTFAGSRSDDFSIYLDGVKQPASTLGGSVRQVDTRTGSAAIGRSVDGNTHYGGDIDDVRVYGYALSAEQVSAIAKRKDAPSIPAYFPVHVPLMPGSSNPLRDGLVRIANPNAQAVGVHILAVDDAGLRRGPVILDVGPGEAAQIGTRDLERGSADMDLRGATGPGSGDWRLELTGDLYVGVLPYVRAADGTLSEMGEVAPVEDGVHRVSLFSPADSQSAAGRLRLTNRGGQALRASITGIDDTGASPGGEVTLKIAADESVLLNAAHLEAGGAGLAGSLGDGIGMWRLSITSDGDLVVMSLVETPDGHLANLSNATPTAVPAHNIHEVAGFPSSTLESGERGLLRIVNSSANRGSIRVRPRNGTGRDAPRLQLHLGGGEAVNLDTLDLELGNPSKGLWEVPDRGLGASGVWRYRLTLPSKCSLTCTHQAACPCLYARTPRRSSEFPEPPWRREGSVSSIAVAVSVVLRLHAGGSFRTAGWNGRPTIRCRSARLRRTRIRTTTRLRASARIAVCSGITSSCSPLT